jgi:CBS domain-containing protein
VFDVFAAKPEIRRIIITDEWKAPETIITRSMMISTLSQNKDLLSSFCSVKLRDIASDLPGWVRSVAPTDSAITAFQKMANQNLSGLAVTNVDGKLTDVITQRDLRGIGRDGKNIYKLWSNVTTYKAELKSKFSSQTPQKLITAKLSDTLGDVLSKFFDGNLKRLFVVDSEDKPVHVLSQFDLLALFMGKFETGMSALKLAVPALFFLWCFFFFFFFVVFVFVFFFAFAHANFNHIHNKTTTLLF